MTTNRRLVVNMPRRAGKATLIRATRPLSTKQLVALLRHRIGRKPPSHTLPGYTPREMWALYETLCRMARALGVRY